LCLLHFKLETPNKYLNEFIYPMHTVFTCAALLYASNFVEMLTSHSQ